MAEGNVFLVLGMSMLLVQKNKHVNDPWPGESPVSLPSPSQSPPTEKGSWVLSLELSFEDRES